MKVLLSSVLLFLFSLVGLLLSGCSGPSRSGPESASPTPGGPLASDTLQAPDDTLDVAEEERREDPLRALEEGGADTVAAPARSFSSWSDSVLASLSLEEKAGQLLMPWMLGDFAPEGSESHQRVVELVEEQAVGGLIVSVGSPTEVAAKLNALQKRARLPLLVSADLERGAGFRLRGAVHLPGAIVLGGATEFPSLMALGATEDPELAYEMGRVTGREARAVGIHVPFAPVLDVNNNPDNPIINVRSLGEDPALVARLGRAFVRGVQSEGALATGKHFPGHGDTETDSHLALPVIRVSRERLEAVELRPFQTAIDAGMQGVMTAHIAVPSLNGGDGLPATLSREILTGLLREEMGFQGLVFTDAMDMFAIDRRFDRGEAAVRALEAGADVLLMPPGPEAARDGVVEAVRSGRLPEERLDASVRRLLEVKEELGLDRRRTVPVEEVPRVVGIPSHEILAREIADRSVTLLRNDRNLLPLLGTRSARVLSVTYRRPSDLLAGRYVNEGLRARYPRLVTAELWRDTPEEVYEGLRRRARASNLVVVSLHVTAVSYSGSVAVPEEVAELIQDLAQARIPHIVISFGNPYLVRDFPDVQAYMLAWSGTEVSQKAAVQALFGAIPVRGRTPTAIPPFFEIGQGIQLPVRRVP
jgi:beta-N-acetylhexosaminidase